MGLAAAQALSIARLATILPTYEDRFVGLLEKFPDWLAPLGIGPDEVATALAEISSSRVAELAPTILAATAPHLLLLLLVIALMPCARVGSRAGCPTSAGHARMSSAH